MVRMGKQLLCGDGPGPGGAKAISGIEVWEAVHGWAVIGRTLGEAV